MISIGVVCRMRAVIAFNDGNQSRRAADVPDMAGAAIGLICFKDVVVVLNRDVALLDPANSSI